MNTNDHEWAINLPVITILLGQKENTILDLLLDLLLDQLKERVLRDILEPEFNEEAPQRLLPRVWFRYRRWQANAWKQRLCYKESRWSAFWSGVWNHLLKPSSI